MHCLKLLGQPLMARDFDRQVAEFQIRTAVLNGFTALGKPVTEAVGYVCPGKGQSGRQPICARESTGDGKASWQPRRWVAERAARPGAAR